MFNNLKTLKNLIMFNQKINVLILFILSSFAIFSCNSIGGNNSSGLTIEGNIDGLRNKTVYLKKLHFNTNSVDKIGEVTADKGVFKMAIDSFPGEGVYKLGSGRSAIKLILSDKDHKIDIEGEFTKFNNNDILVKGSKLTEDYNSTLNDFRTKKMNAEQAFNTVKNLDPMLSTVLMFDIFGAKPDFLNMHEQVYKNMNEKYPNSNLTKEYSSVIESIKVLQKRQQANAKIKVGQPAPEISMPGVDGKIKKLSDLKGKVTLIDFWASWCGPCKRSFPELTKIYNKYKNKGFTVYSVSLDGIDKRSAKRYKTSEDLAKAKENKKERWIKAIKDYNLSWDYHVSDLDKWDCKAAAVYGVRSIPKTFLLDRDGNIAFVNPRYNLEEAIKTVLSKKDK